MQIVCRVCIYMGLLQVEEEIKEQSNLKRGCGWEEVCTVDKNARVLGKTTGMAQGAWIFLGGTCVPCVPR